MTQSVLKIGNPLLVMVKVMMVSSLILKAFGTVVAVKERLWSLKANC
ncbi:hypothetical protein [Escherichia phage BI-EHEC]|nr:hypothetical protein [Escherichia phage BI-EHEC]